MGTDVRLVDRPEHFVRLAFTQHLFEAGSQGEGEPAFSVTAIIPRNHPVHEELLAAEEEAAIQKWGAEGKHTDKSRAILKQVRAAGKGVIKDGDLKANWAGFEGNDFVSMRAKPDQKPNIYNQFGKKLETNDGTIYSGCYAHLKCNVWAQDNQYGKRINAQITGGAFSRDGDSFGGGATPASADDFADLSAAGEDLLG